MQINNYSGTKCPKCGITSFEVVEDKPTKSNFKFNYIRCSSCKTFLSALEHYNIGNTLNRLAIALKINLDEIKY